MKKDREKQVKKQYYCWSCQKPKTAKKINIYNDTEELKCQNCGSYAIDLLEMVDQK